MKCGRPGEGERSEETGSWWDQLTVVAVAVVVVVVVVVAVVRTEEK